MTLSPWVLFVLSAAVVVFAASRLARYGDIIAVRSGLGGLLFGTIFLAAATSLPEFVTAISAFRAGLPDLAAGNFFGSNMVNVLVLALVDLINYRVPMLRRMAITHALTALFGMLLILIAVIAIMANHDLAIGWVGVESLLLIGLYFAGVYLIRQENTIAASGQAPQAVAIDEDFPKLREGILGFTAMAVILVLAVPQMVDASAGIAAITGLGESFVGTALLSVVTSLPELLAAWAAVRLGAYDLAVGNLFGSSLFNMFGLGVADLFYLPGRFLGAIDPNFALVGILGLLLMTMALVANLARVERKFLFIELDALAIIFVYFAGMYLLFLNGA